MKRYGQDLPAEYAEPPALWPELFFFWAAFQELDTDRQIGFSEGPIPFRAIDAFARRYGICDLDEFDRFVTIMRGMDAELQAYRAKKIKQATSLKEKEAEAEPPKRLPKLLGKGKS